MFKTAEELTAANHAALYDKLEAAVSELDTDDYELTSRAVKARRIALLDAADLAHRIASFSYDPEDTAELRIVAENLRYEANELAEVQQDLANEEYNNHTVANVLFSAPLADESNNRVSHVTDWNIFMAVEPREFVASNYGVDNNELSLRALAFIDNATAGHGMSRSAKKNVASEFIARVSSLNIPIESSLEEDTETSFDDSDLFS